MQYVIHEVTGSDTCGEKHVDTDLYCAEQHRARISFPVLVIATVAGTGVLAVLAAGFLGYSNCQPAYQVIAQQKVPSAPCLGDFWFRTHFLYLNEPWPLFIWFSGLLLLLQVAILRHHLRSLIAMLAITIASITVVAVVYVLGVDAVVKYIADPQNQTGLVYDPWVYSLLNFGIIVAFLVDSLRRWIGYRTTELSAATMEALKRADPSHSVHARRAKLGELISGDLIAGMILCAVLSVAFSQWFMLGVYSVAGGAEFNCNVTPVPVACPVAVQHNSLFVPDYIPLLGTHPINSIDSFLAGLCFVPGVAVLAMTAFLRGLTPLGGASGASSSRMTLAAGGSTENVTAQVGMAVLDSLREAIQRYILPYARRAALSLRNVFWPLLVLVATFSLALCARYIQYYLHHYDPSYNCDSNYVSVQRISNPAFVCTSVSDVSHLEKAISFGIVGVLCAVISCALLLTSTRVFTNTFRLLRRIGTVGLLTFWMFALALFGLNWLLLDLGIVPASLAPLGSLSENTCMAPSWQLMVAPPNAVCAQPFKPTWLTGISFAATLLALIILVLRINTGFFSLRKATASVGVASQARS